MRGTCPSFFIGRDSDGAPDWMYVSMHPAVAVATMLDQCANRSRLRGDARPVGKHKGDQGHRLLWSAEARGSNRIPAGSDSRLREREREREREKEKA